MSRNDLPDLRKRINSVDDLLIQLLAQRMSLVLKVERVKREKGEEIRCPAREKEELARVLAKAEQTKLPLDPDFVSTLFQLIFDESVKVQEIQRETAD